MNKGVKTIALILLIASCIICMPAWGKEKKQKEKKYTPKNLMWVYDDDTHEYEKERTYNNRMRYFNVSYKKNNREVEGPDSDTLFIAPGGRYTKFYDPDAKQGINNLKRKEKDFEN